VELATQQAPPSSGSNSRDETAALDKPAPLSSIDLFCGAGGLSLGLKAAGIQFGAHLDSWEPAVETLNRNFGESNAAVDVSTLTASQIRIMSGGATPQLISGGPPCQSFTSAGRRFDDDPRSTLVGAFATLAAEVRSPLVVFENVEGFVTAGKGEFVFDLLTPLIDAGYWLRMRKVNLANYGVPQHRKRVIMVASLSGCPPFPQPTHSAWGVPGAQEIPGCPATPTVAEALGDLPAPGSQNAPQGHLSPPIGELELARLTALRPGQTMRDLPEELWHDSYRKRAYRRVMDGTPMERRGGAPAGLRRLRGDQPSKAITSASVREFIHPTKDRRLTLREAARLQTFPDSFKFSGNLAEQATQIGNAVPPRFSEALGSSLIDHLTRYAGADQRIPGEGALVEFNVTSSQQMSPALSRVVTAVGARFTDSLFAAAED
jgi:DNA (cytosine-5)-methyltransferase 1